MRLLAAVSRRYVLRLPPGGTGARPFPLVLALHGLDLEGDSRRGVHGFRAWWTMDAVADRGGFAVVYPEAVAGRLNHGSGGTVLPLCVHGGGGLALSLDGPADAGCGALTSASGQA